jgi:Na+/H+ antiporter NhaA
MKTKKTLWKTLTSLYTAAFFICALTSTAFADNKFDGSNLGKGVKNLLTDLTGWAVIIAPAIGTLIVVYCLIRMSAADEMDAKTWKKRMGVTIGCVIGVIVASGLLNIIKEYFK